MTPIVQRHLSVVAEDKKAMVYCNTLLATLEKCIAYEHLWRSGSTGDTLFIQKSHPVLELARANLRIQIGIVIGFLDYKFSSHLYN